MFGCCVVLQRFAFAQLCENIVDGLAGVRAHAGLHDRDRSRGPLGLLYRGCGRKIREALADQDLQRAQVGEIRIGPRVRGLQPRRTGLDIRDRGVVRGDVLPIGGQQEAAQRTDRSGERILQLVDALFAHRGLLQALTGFLQPLLTGARQEKQRGQETDNQKRRYRDVPSAESVERFP
ncbi:MAG TPA: hypothetical protein VNZ53_18260 [Steroidobacteraceae bacterium]|nr:hypothetical protein [Steroidobacteraceae bacterium]